MSNLFLRPDPRIATAQDIEKAIDGITAWDWETGYSFAHIVIDDMNLGDRNILYCLQPDNIANIMKQRLRDKFRKDRELSTLQDWELSIYREEMRHMAEIVDLLNWILDVPEEVRNEVGN